MEESLRDRIDNCLIELDLTREYIYNDLKEFYSDLYADFELKREIDLSLNLVKNDVKNYLILLRSFKQLNYSVDITDIEIIETLIDNKQKIYDLILSGMQTNINEEKVDLYYSNSTDEDDDYEQSGQQQLQSNIKLKLSEIKREIQSCPICYEKYTDDDSLIILECRHAFHEACFNKWKKNNCPCCRK